MKPLSSCGPCAARLFAVAFLAAGAYSLAPTHVSAASADNRIAADAAATTPVFYPITAQEGQVGKPFAYQVAAQDGPVTYAAANLPDGLAIDSATGLISGTPTTAGVSNATVSATNASGTTNAALALTIALPPSVITLTAGVVSGYPAQGVVGSFVLSRTGDITVPVTVNLLIQGSAKNGVDYMMTNATKKFKPGKASKNIKIQAIDESGQGITKKSVKVSVLPSSDYTLGTSIQAKVKIYYTP